MIKELREVAAMAQTVVHSAMRTMALGLVTTFTVPWTLALTLEHSLARTMELAPRGNTSIVRPLMDNDATLKYNRMTDHIFNNNDTNFAKCGDNNKDNHNNNINNEHNHKDLNHDNINIATKNHNHINTSNNNNQTPH